MPDQEYSPQPSPAADETLTKAERKRLRRAEKTLRRERELSGARRRRLLKSILPAVLAMAVLGYLGYRIATAPTLSRQGLVSQKEIHWHARLDITIRGQAVEIPANIGIPVGVPNAHPQNMHTHAADRIIHIEKLPPVYESDLKLGNFFQVWGKRFDSQCILDACVAEGNSLKMTVNGRENHDFQNYLLRDGDQVEIMFE